MNELQISKKKKEIEQAYDNKNVELLLDLSSNYIYANIGNFKEHLYIIEVFKKLIKYIDNNYLKYKHKLINILNHIGILSYYNSYYTIAINCYYLAMIQCDITKRANYYFNIALSLHSLNSFEKANVYYKKSISYANDDTIQYTLNYISCLIAQNDIKKANLLFEELKRSNKFEEQGYLNFSYTYIKLYLSLVINKDFELIKDEFYKQKEILTGNNSYHSLLTLNNLILELTVIESLNDKKKLLLENLKYADFIDNIEVKRAAVIALIDFYRKTNNKDEAYILFEKLLELDKTPKHHMEEELIELYLNMQKNIILHLLQKNELISNQKKELEEITYLLSHDLKTPMRTISSFANLIERNLNTKNFNDIPEYLSFIKKSCGNIYELIDDIAMFHQVESENNICTSINLNEIVKKIEINLKDTLQKKGGEIIVNKELPQIRGIKQYIIVLFQNLIENAIKYNKSKKPTVCITSNIKDNKIHITFTDNGIGIENAYHKQIFSFFKRLHNSSEYEGTGFGLGICKKIVSKHNGEIKMKSKLGEGSTFKVILPDLL